MRMIGWKATEYLPCWGPLEDYAYRCRLCGALVDHGDLRDHDEWHVFKGERIATPTENGRPV